MAPGGHNARCSHQRLHHRAGSTAAVIDLITRATDGLVERAPGFISSTLHRSIDGAKVTMVATWRSAEDYQAMRQDPRPLPFLQEALTFATFEPGMYEIVRTFKAKP